jgi:xylulokinase
MAQATQPPANDSPATVLGIDLGTSSVKAVVARLDGSVAGQAGADYQVRSPRPGWSETAPSDWLAATAAAVRSAVAQAGADPAAVGLSGQMHGVVATADDGRPVRPAMLWSDARAVGELAHYRRLPPAALARLANPLSPGMAGPMLAWLAVHEPGTYAATRWALQPKDWLRAQLTGRFATEPSDASATLLYDVAGDAWDADVLHALALDAAKLPPILPRAAERAGTLTADAAALLGLRAGIPVAAGAADTAAAALGSGLTEPGTVQLTVGTGAQIVKPVAALPRPLPARPVTHLYRAATDTGWYAMGAVLNGGLTLGWVCRTLGAGWPELYAAAAIAPRLDDPYFLPHLNGERTPYLDPGLRAAWTGLAPNHGRAQLLRAALEGVAFAIRDALEHVLEPGERVSHLRLAGGGTTDPAWRQMLADILGHALAPVEVTAASGLGAAMLGARAAGLPGRLAGPPRGATTTSVTTPHDDNTDLYRERHHAYHRKIQALRGTDNDTVGIAGAALHSAASVSG